MGWVLRAVWFDTALRGLQAGSPRTGGARRAAGSSEGGSGRGGMVCRDCWLLLGPGRGRRDGGRAEGWVLHPRVWFDAAPSAGSGQASERLQAGSPRTGNRRARVRGRRAGLRRRPYARGGCGREGGWLGGAVWGRGRSSAGPRLRAAWATSDERGGVVRNGPPEDSGPAHHERMGRVGGSGGSGRMGGRGGMVRSGSWLLLGPGRGRRDGG